MRVILTHEQADFDAVASLLGAHLLDDTALPVLPRRMNRNVRAFITIYGAELPFIEQRDIPSEPVELIYIVDTQSIVTVKGIHAGTRVHIIDHHPRRENLPVEWRVVREDIGATVTLLVEELRQRNGHLSLIQATLLLLGIYEDTGSLTYSQTTSRDLQAAAYLLECGASLKIMADYLNHPLSTDQQVLYDHLRKTAETYHFHGHTIVLTRGNAEQLDEELSSLAHKLRDLLDPDALFLVVATRGGIQLIARSTSDNIDVAEITAQFGGGGHSRAAAGLVKDRTLDEVCADLLEMLPRYVRPAVTVSQIMSRSPQLLSPETNVVDAAQRMQRYGYEGYPVVKDGKVVGLLTRREVDRALAHKLNLPAASLMNAGEVSIDPDDSIEQLQRLMTETGWGQVPVVHPISKDIIGIVTRTDLLKTLTPQTIPVSSLNFADLLEKALPPARLALLKLVAQAAHQQRAAIYIVGGFVRDLIMERPSLDFDFVIEGDAITLAKTLAHLYGGRVTTHARFGTAKWHITARVVEGLENQLYLETSSLEQSDLPEFLDLISARTEFYTYPTALPTVESGSIKLDLHRRDFTINTLALRLDGRHYGELHDYWGGLSDLRLGLVRVLHSLSFVDDPTRMLRAVRFEQRFGFTVEERSLELMNEALTLLDRVSGDRIHHEMNHILLENKAPRMLARLQELGLLATIHRGLVWDRWLQEKFNILYSDATLANWFVSEIAPTNHQNWMNARLLLGYVLWFMRLSAEDIRRVSKRLKLPKQYLSAILAANRIQRKMKDLMAALPSVVVAELDEYPILSVGAVYLASDDKSQSEIISKYIQHWRKVTPTITGYDLRARGLPPGPVYRQVLSALRASWLDGKIHTTIEEQALLEQLLADFSPSENEPGCLNSRI